MSIIEFSKGQEGIKDHDINASFLCKLPRPLAVIIAKKLAKTNITPNQISFLGFLIAVPAALLFIIGGHFYVLLGGILAFLSYFMDSLDGSLARIKKIASNYGKWIDMACCQFGEIFLFFGITLGIYLKTGSILIWIFGFLAISAVLRMNVMYNAMRRLFPKGYNIIQKEKKKHTFIKNFFFSEDFIYYFMLVCAILNQMSFFIIFSAVYGWIFAIISFLVLTKRLKYTKS
jgi:phosphatidylglycerophosphate synthase